MDTRKICLLGDRWVGKTSIVDRYVRGAWPRPAFQAASVKVDGRVIQAPCGERRLLLWEIARAVVPTGEYSNYLHGAQGFVLVADGTRAGTVQYVLGQWQLAKAVLKTDVPAILLINKRDVTDRWISSSRVIERALRALPVFITSARTGESIEEAFACIGERALSGLAESEDIAIRHGLA